MAKLIDGKAIAKSIYDNINLRVRELRSKGVIPKLAVVLVGDDPASRLYVNSKEKRAMENGIETEEYHLDGSVAEAQVTELIKKLNDDDTVHGILVQLPLPKHMDKQRVLSCISPDKDVDGLHAVNAGALMTGSRGFIPCTPKGILHLVKSTGIDVSGKRCTVVGRSSLVGKPAALLMLNSDATVTVCHSRTADLGSITKEADILICAAGRPKLITADMVKPGAVVIDVGQNKIDGKWCGDVDFEPVEKIAGYITPVPGGVGPMTIAMLMQNTVEAAENTIVG